MISGSRSLSVSMSYRKRKDPECPIVLDSRGSSTLPQRDGKRQDPKSPPDKGKT